MSIKVAQQVALVDHHQAHIVHAEEVLVNNTSLIMDNILNSSYVNDAFNAIAYIFMAFFLFWIGKRVYQLFHPTIDVQNELVIKDNFAFSVAHTGYFIGLLISIGGTIIGETNGLIADLFDMLVYGLFSIFLLNVSIFINDKVILRQFSVEKEICIDRNAGTGLVEAASAIASGLVIYGAVSGDAIAPLWSIIDGSSDYFSYGPYMGIINTVQFWFIGLVIMIFTAWFYNKTLPYNALDEIEKDNVAVGFGFAGALVAIAILVSHALAGNFEGWGATFIKVGFEMGIGIVLLPIARYLTDKILLPGQNLTDELVNQEKSNIGAGLIEAFSYIGGAILVTWCI